MPLPDTFLPHCTVRDWLAERGVEPVDASSGAQRYDLNSLRDKPDGSDKINLFITDTKFTFARSIRETRRVYEDTPRERMYSVWQKTSSVTLSAKKNMDGMGSFNLYAHTPRRGLQNFTSRPHKVLPMVPEPLQELVMLCAAELHNRHLRPWHPMPIRTLDERVDALLVNTYPAFFVDDAVSPQRRETFFKRVPSALYPLLRLHDTVALVDALFGTDADPLLYTLAETGLEPHLLVGGYLFGLKMPVESLLPLAQAPAPLPLVKHLHEIKQVLNRCDTTSLNNALGDYLTLAGSKQPHLARALDGLDAQFAEITRKPAFRNGIKFRQVPVMTDVKTLPDVGKHLRDHIRLLGEKTRETEKDQTARILDRLNTMFEPARGEQERDGYWLEINRERGALMMCSKEAGDMYPRRMPLFETAPRDMYQQLMVSNMFAGQYTHLPARHALYDFFAAQRKAGILKDAVKSPGNTVVDYADADAFLDDFEACLRRIVKRHGVTATPRGLGDLVLLLHLRYQHCLTHDHTGHRLKRPPVPEYLYGYLREPVDADTTLFGVKWDMPAQQAEHYRRVLPPSFQQDLVRASSALSGQGRDDPF